MPGQPRVDRGRDADAGRAVSLGASEEETGVVVDDHVDRHRYTLATGGPVSPTAVDTDRFTHPVDAAVSVRAEELALPSVFLVYARTLDGEMAASAEHLASVHLPGGEYCLELTTPVKTYVRVDGAVSIVSDTDRTRIQFDTDAEILVGARSRHENPAGTITTTRDPEDLMAAVSHLGSALKTTSAERSYPTLRGHPPLVELGDELSVPAGLERPDTGVRIELPRDPRHVFVAAPLAYYLGAEVVPGEEPRIVTDRGFAHVLDGPHGFERGVERALKQVFLLDCVTRTEGLYDIDLREREAVEAAVDIDFGALYDEPLAEQLPAYLSVPYESIEPHVPDWRLTTHVSTDPESVELLPFFLDELAVVRSPDTEEPTTADAQAAAIDEFVRDGEFTRSAGEVSAPSFSTVQPTEADSLEQAWVGDGAPLGASKSTLEAYRNRLSRGPGHGDIDITVVCNDPEMAEEQDLVGDIYGTREELPFSVTTHRELTAPELRDVLAGDADFLHYIGHIDDDGFECADGKLDATTLEAVGVDAFFLNACQSYEQGMALIEGGSIGGVVTLREVLNSGAVTVGSTLARLLNQGFPLRSGLDVAKDESVVGSQYVVVGDGGFAVTQSESGAPLLCKLEDAAEDGTYELSLVAYPSSDGGIGSTFVPHVDGVRNHYICSGEIDTFIVDRGELLDFLALEDAPIQYGGALRWSSEFVRELEN